jgi:hypothetical protein
MSQSFCKQFDYRDTPQSAGLLDSMKPAPKFGIGDIVRHEKTGGEYRIIRTPSHLRIEATGATAYAYSADTMADQTWWIRPQAEMEDGRFTVVQRRPNPAHGAPKPAGHKPVA